MDTIKKSPLQRLMASKDPVLRGSLAAMRRAARAAKALAIFTRKEKNSLIVAVVKSLTDVRRAQRKSFLRQLRAVWIVFTERNLDSQSRRYRR